MATKIESLRRPSLLSRIATTLSVKARVRKAVRVEAEAIRHSPCEICGAEVDDCNNRFCLSCDLAIL
ncbi:hypothetical protein [Sphingobium amiense]|uniref:hypothetical protein n=1 Tax=Sphingobium amiense TaxID=135719 RepID=UPI000836D3B9|nr:hypothetical protein [Sphingobium amiense]